MAAPWMPLAATALLLSFSATLLVVIAMATDHWAWFKTPDGEARFRNTVQGHRGLIKNCPGKVCTEHDDMGRVDDYIRGTLAALCIAILGNGIAVATHIMWMLNCFSESITKILKVVTLILLAVTVFMHLCALTAFAVGDGNSRHSASDEDYMLSWSWGLVLLAGILDIIAVALLVLARRKETY